MFGLSLVARSFSTLRDGFVIALRFWSRFIPSFVSFVVFVVRVVALLCRAVLLILFVRVGRSFTVCCVVAVVYKGLFE